MNFLLSVAALLTDPALVWNWHDKVSWGVNIALAVVGICGVIAAFITLKKIERQTRATEQAAMATEKSAKATEEAVRIAQNAERAWIVEEINFPSKLPTEAEISGGVIVVNFVLKNIGRQPAIVRNVQIRFHAPVGKLPDLPEYSLLTFVPDPQLGANGKMLASNESFTCSGFLEQGSFTDDEIHKISRGKMALYAYGRVSYESVGLAGVSQFCYKWHDLWGFSYSGDKEGFRREGPADYNRTT